VKPITQQLDLLDQLKHNFSSRDVARLEKLLSQLARIRVRDAESLIRFHETLLFLRAYPRSARVVKLTESLLLTIPERVEKLDDQGAIGHPEVSGIAGTAVTDTFSYNIVRWLLDRHPNQVSLDWEWFENENRLAQTWPRFMPLLDEDALVEANVPYREWLRAAAGGKRELEWIVARFEQLPLTQKQRAELFDSLQLYVSWTPAYRASRTGMRLPVEKLFYHRGPLLQRRDVDFRAELEKPAPDFHPLPQSRARRILDMIRETSTVRYRELYGFTHGDDQRSIKVSLGRGVDLFVFGVPANRRLPLRAYHAAMIFKNGVPAGYFEGLSLFERMESGFNFYYTFREGETAWIYARTLNVFRHLLNVTAFSIDPYQIGFENEEGIESGAFWFYRKLGFRPTDPKIEELTKREEQKIASRKGYRTSATMLRRLAGGSMIFELTSTREWDRFSIRKVGLKVQKRMAARYRGDADEARKRSVASVSRKLGMASRDWSDVQLQALSDFSVALDLVPDLDEWTESEKRDLVQVIRAKAGADEARYLKLMQRHARLRRAFIKLGT
jgi:hypothetical protein